MEEGAVPPKLGSARCSPPRNPTGKTGSVLAPRCSNPGIATPGSVLPAPTPRSLDLGAKLENGRGSRRAQPGPPLALPSPCENGMGTLELV